LYKFTQKEPILPDLISEKPHASKNFSKCGPWLPKIHGNAIFETNGEKKLRPVKEA